MATIRLPTDFKEFLGLLNSEQIEYLLVGGHAVGYYGYPRSTGDMDVWIAANSKNAAAIVRVLENFGFAAGSISADLFLTPNKVVRIGNPPLRINLLTSISGVDFDQCHAQRTVDVIDGAEVGLISLDHLKANKRSAGRSRDMDHLEHLP